MKIENLLETATQLEQVSVSASTEYYLKSEELVSKMNATMLARADMMDLVGEKNIEMMKDNHANHVRFIASILMNHNPTVLVETILWVFRAYRSHGFTTNYWSAQLHTWMVVLKEVLSDETYKEVYPLYHWMIINIPLFVKLSDEKLENTNSLH